MAPFTDAVCFVDGHEGAIEIASQPPEPGKGQPFGRDVGYGILAARQTGHPPPNFIGAQGGCQKGGGHTHGLERGHLVVHQGHQRRHHQRGTAEDRGGKLVDQTLAAAGRGHEEQAPPVNDRLDRFPLARPERRVAQAGQRGVEIRGGDGDGHGGANIAGSVGEMQLRFLFTRFCDERFRRHQAPRIGQELAKRRRPDLGKPNEHVGIVAVVLGDIG